MHLRPRPSLSALLLLSIPLCAQELRDWNWKLSAPLGAGGAVGAFQLRAGRVEDAADAEVDVRHELFGVPLAGQPPAVRLNDVAVAGGSVQEDVREFQSERQHVAYAADQDTDGVVERAERHGDAHARNAEAAPREARVRARIERGPGRDQRSKAPIETALPSGRPTSA